MYVGCSVCWPMRRIGLGGRAAVRAVVHLRPSFCNRQKVLRLYTETALRNSSVCVCGGDSQCVILIGVCARKKTDIYLHCNSCGWSFMTTGRGNLLTKIYCLQRRDCRISSKFMTEAKRKLLEFEVMCYSCVCLDLCRSLMAWSDGRGSDWWQSYDVHRFGWSRCRWIAFDAQFVTWFHRWWNWSITRRDDRWESTSLSQTRNLVEYTEFTDANNIEPTDLGYCSCWW